MRDRPKRNVDLENCNCCIITCSPCLSIWLCLEYALKGLCYCPCYTDFYCCDKNKKTVIPEPNVIFYPVEVPVESVRTEVKVQSLS